MKGERDKQRGSLLLQMRGNGKKHSEMQKIKIKTIKIHSHTCSAIVNCEILKIKFILVIHFIEKIYKVWKGAALEAFCFTVVLF